MSKALPQALEVFNSLTADNSIPDSPEYVWMRSEDYCTFCMEQALENLDRSLDGWRELYRSVQNQMQECYDIINAPPTLHSPEERRQAQNRFHDALMQREMLIKAAHPGIRTSIPIATWQARASCRDITSRVCP